jgi:hypothetical protein
MPRALPDETSLSVPLTDDEYQRLRAVARRTSREAGQYAQWLLRQLLAGRLAVPDECVADSAPKAPSA